MNPYDEVIRENARAVRESERREWDEDDEQPHVPALPRRRKSKRYTTPRVRKV